MGSAQSFLNQIFDSSTVWRDLKWEDSFRTQKVLQEIINNKTTLVTGKRGKREGALLKDNYFLARFLTGNFYFVL